MKFRYTSFAVFLVFFEHYILLTWSSSDKDNQDRSPVKEGELPPGHFMKSARSGSKTVKQKQDKKGKAVVSSPAEAETSTAGGLRSYVRWTKEQNEELLRYYYGYQLKRAFKGTERLRDWKKITDFWIARHGNIEKNQLKVHAYNLRGKMQEAAKSFDDHHPEAGDIPWTAILNDDLMKMYYATEAGDKSKHGERMHAEWVRMRYPNYETVTPGYLLNRAEAMLDNAKRCLFSNQTIDQYQSGHNPIWREEHDEFFEKLWQKYPAYQKNRKEKIYNDFVAKFQELGDVGLPRLYERARRFHKNVKKHEKMSGFTKDYVKKCDSEEFIVDGFVNWKPYHDKYLMELWNEPQNYKEGRIQRIYKKGVQKFPEFRELTTAQVYDHAKYLRNKAQKRKTLETSNQELTPKTRVQYHHFIGDQGIPSNSPGIHHRHEMIASTSSYPGQSYEHSNLESSLEALDFREQSPDTTLKLR